MSQLRCEKLSVLHTCFCRNRGVVDGADFAGELPDVLVGSVPVQMSPFYVHDTEFHFASASVHQLLESSLFKRLCDAAAATSGDAAAFSARLGLAKPVVDEIQAHYHPTFTKPGALWSRVCFEIHTDL
jgi:hypothetical protein